MHTVHMIKHTTRATIRTESIMIHTTHATVSTCILHILHHAYIYIYYMNTCLQLRACVRVCLCRHASLRVYVYIHILHACMCRVCMQVCEAMYGYICMCMHSTILGASAERIHVYFIASHTRSLFTFRPRTTINAYMSLFA